VKLYDNNDDDGIKKEEDLEFWNIKKNQRKNKKLIIEWTQTITTMYRPNFYESSCFRCNEIVYQVDRIGPLKDFTFFHTGCFKCRTCGTKLTLKSYFNNQNQQDDKEVSWKNFCCCVMFVKESCWIESRSYSLCRACDEWKYLIKFFHVFNSSIKRPISFISLKSSENPHKSPVFSQALTSVICYFETWSQLFIQSLWHHCANFNCLATQKTFQVLFNSSAKALKFQLTANIAKRIWEKRKEKRVQLTFFKYRARIQFLCEIKKKTWAEREKAEKKNIFFL
jgi:hypothetical protein